MPGAHQCLGRCAELVPSRGQAVPPRLEVARPSRPSEGAPHGSVKPWTRRATGRRKLILPRRLVNTRSRGESRRRSSNTLFVVRPVAIRSLRRQGARGPQLPSCIRFPSAGVTSRITTLDGGVYITSRCAAVLVPPKRPCARFRRIRRGRSGCLKAPPFRGLGNVWQMTHRGAAFAAKISVFLLDFRLFFSVMTVACEMLYPLA